ncbi:hypothetical protein ENSA5_62220 [Enhygromyxa salina]|uniref:Uncharacterized protein n=1 Tax=Enhygromyxa salina TaxID=215803 RepID=A0A2S9XD42_9BACT|nr:DUF3349 domain-containing protein [Enhygromyxa salina]PRP90788.1 hypothetical protein ENSA5_62220 [Enhygromyxa salina]
MTENGPPYIAPALKMLRRAYPNGIPDVDILPIMAVLSDAGLSNRNVAAVLGHYHDRSYKDFLYQASTCSLDEDVTELAKFAVRDHLSRFGYEEWKSALD